MTALDPQTEVQTNRFDHLLGFQNQVDSASVSSKAEGENHMLGLRHGATENITVVRELLVDLRERRLVTEATLQVALDGSKTLYEGAK